MILYLKLLRSAQLCKHICGVCLSSGLMLLTPVSVDAQRRNETSVSETVILTVPIKLSQRDMEADVVSSGSSIRMTLSGNGAKPRVIRVPLLVRSNVDFRISASAETKAAVLTQLSVVDVRSTGRLVSPEAIRKLTIPKQFNMRGQKDKHPSEKASSILDGSRAFFLLSGPRVSLGGTRESPNNALQITVLIRLKPHSNRDWQVGLLFFHDKTTIDGSR